MIRKWMGLILLACTAGSAWAAANGGVVVRNAWVGESVPGQTTASVQMVLTSTLQSGKLVMLESPAAGAVELQRLWPSGGKVKMSKVRNVRLSRGVPFEFGAKKTSIMMLNLKQPLKQGDHIPLTLTLMLANGEKVVMEVSVEVKALALSYEHYQGGAVQDQQSR